MNNISNAQRDTKTFFKGVSMISAIVLGPSIALSNVYVVPNLSNSSIAHCSSTGKKSSNGLELVECCWTVKVPDGTGYKGEHSELYCSECENGGTRGYINCSEPELQFRTAPTTDESIFPNEDDNFLDEQQPNPNSPLNDQRVPTGNVGTLEQLEDSSNNQNSESGDYVSSDNPGLFNVVPQNPIVSQQ